jgi:hypothetical protein
LTFSVAVWALLKNLGQGGYFGILSSVIFSIVHLNFFYNKTKVEATGFRPAKKTSSTLDLEKMKISKKEQ